MSRAGRLQRRPDKEPTNVHTYQYELCVNTINEITRNCGVDLGGADSYQDSKKNTGTVFIFIFGLQGVVRDGKSHVRFYH